VFDLTPQQDRVAAVSGAGYPDAQLPDYLERYYWWAYLRPASLRIFDRRWVVNAILWGQYRRLCDAAIAEMAPGTEVLQLACVYGDLTPRLARHLGPSGRLDVVDIAPLQIDNTRAKLKGMPWANAYVADAADPGSETYDTVLSFFLLHELPDALKTRVVDAALAQVRPGGLVIFIDYARPAPWHPLRPVMAAVFALLEPFAKTLWRREIISFATDAADFYWIREAHFGGLYQKTIAIRRFAPNENPNATDTGHLN
jgi:SAM-dependent methyltransferase